MRYRSEKVIFDENLIEEREYWVRRLFHGYGASNLRPDFPRLGGGLEERDQVEVSLGREVYGKLMSLTGGGGFLLYTALLARLKVFLHKYGGNAWVAIGSPARRRAENGAEPGNVVAIVDEINPERTFQQVLFEVRKSLLEAYERQEYPFDRVVRDL